MHCPLCDTEKDVKFFTDNKLYHIHKVCISCCVKASKRLTLLTAYDMQICEDFKLDYNLLNSLKGLLFDKQFDKQSIESERIINESEDSPLDENVPNDSLT